MWLWELSIKEIPYSYSWVCVNVEEMHGYESLVLEKGRKYLCVADKPGPFELITLNIDILQIIKFIHVIYISTAGIKNDYV